MFRNGDLAKVAIQNSTINERLVRVIGVHTKLPVVNNVYIVQLVGPHHEEWDAYTVPEHYLIKMEN